MVETTKMLHLEDKNSKMNAVTCPLSTSDIGSLLKSAYSQLKSKSKDADTASEQTEIRNRRLDEATATAVAALRLQGTDTHSENEGCLVSLTRGNDRR